MDIITYKCDECKSVGQDETYRQNPKNFDTIRVEIGSNAVGAPMHNPMFISSFKICKACQERTDGFKVELEALIAPLKANQKELQDEHSAIINS